MPTPLSGLMAVLNAAFGDGQVFYLMLTDTVMNINSDLTAAAAGELSGNGYSRQAFTFGTAIATPDGFAEVVGTLVQFTATGGNLLFNSLVVTDAATGSSGTVWSYYNYPEQVLVNNGSTFSAQYPIKESTS